MSIETRTKIASVTVGAGGVGIIDINNIPQTYSDLIVEFSLRTSYNGMADMYLRFSDAGGSTQYTYIRTGSNGIAQESTTANSVDNFVFAGGFGSNAPANYFGNGTIYIPDYTNSRQKTLLSRHGSSMSSGSDSGRLGMNAMYFNSTSPITRLYFSVAVGWAQNSTVSVYGVNNARRTAGNSIKAIGGNVEFDGTYVYHTFNSSGTFTPTSPLTADYLVVAGGGGGGYQHGGGGGAGGLRCTVTATGGGGSLESKINLLPNNNYSVIVGAGGAASPNTGGSNNGAIASNGSNSDFATITSIGGGGGSSYRSATSQTAATGGSGGGGGSTTSGSLPNKGSGTANQGYAGGNGRVGDSPNIGGGGGGAGAVGGDASGNAGNGGAGITSIISGSSITYAGGGGGGSDGTVAAAGSGGSGGGGAGSKTTTAATSGTANTGGGGGGAGVIGGVGGAGGSGIVIIRYKG